VNIDVIPATVQDQTAMRNLFQFYLYEFSRFTEWHTTYSGRFIEDDLEGCWTDLKRKPYLLKVEGDLAGFAIIDTLEQSRYDADLKAITSMSEFFVMAAFQGQGFGEKAASQLFDLYPGKWEVFQMKRNVNALAFWRKVIGRYTKNQYREIFSARYNGTVQFFDNSKPKT